MTQRRRVKVSTTLDPDLLDAMDRFINAHPGADRGRVFDEALRMWSAHQQQQAMEAQYEDDGDIDPDELASWRAIRDAAARERLGRELEE